MKRFFHYLVEGFLRISGSVTSLVIILIILFLFKEAFGLFNEPIVQKGYLLVVNKDNPISRLKPEQIKSIFDQDITSWNEVGDYNSPIHSVRFSALIKGVEAEDLEKDPNLVAARIDSVLAIKGTILYVPQKYLPPDNLGKILNEGTITPADFFGSKEWYPTATPTPIFGLIPLLLGTLMVSIGAIVIALPLGIAVAIFMAEIASVKLRNIVKPVIELLAGIPSVVYGFFGLVVLVPLIQTVFNLPVGETALAGSIILAIMALPTIITVAEDAIRNTPMAMKEASLALGATHWQTIYKVVLPYAKSGIASAAILGIGRAIGETMAVLMVTGNAAIIPTTLFEPVRTIPATIAAELGEAPKGGAHYEALFMLGVVLFFITLLLSLYVEYIVNRKK